MPSTTLDKTKVDELKGKYDETVMLSCDHVLYANGGQQGQNIFQQYTILIVLPWGIGYNNTNMELIFYSAHVPPT